MILHKLSMQAVNSTQLLCMTCILIELLINKITSINRDLSLVSNDDLKTAIRQLK